MDWQQIIISLKTMLQDERNHLKFLQEKDAPEGMQKRSSEQIKHLEIRLEQYQNFVKENGLA